MKQLLLLFILLISITNFYAQTFYDGVLKYTVIDTDNNYVSVGKYDNNTCPSGDIVIPETIEESGVIYTVTFIEHYAFTSSYLYCLDITSIDLPDSITSIGNFAFRNCRGLTSIDLPDSITSIGYYAFQDSGLTSIDLPNSITNIEGGAFEFCTDLTYVNLPNSLLSIGPTIFATCTSLSSIDLPDSLTSIGPAAFLACTSLTSIDLPDSITDIGDSAFLYCIGLTSLNLPDSITSIGDYAFVDCTSLNSVSVNWQTPLDINANVFENVAINGIPLTVPSGTESLYQSAAVWEDFDYNTLSTEELDSETFQVYVNRNLEQIELKLKATQILKQVNLYSINGKHSYANKKLIIPTANLSSGIYILVVETNYGKSAKKIIF